MLTLRPAPPPPTVKKMGKTADELGIKPLTPLALAVMAASRVITKGQGQ